jgi:hypothetical protein
MESRTIPDRVWLEECVAHPRIHDPQEAMIVVHRAGRIDLGESLGARAELMAEALDTATRSMPQCHVRASGTGKLPGNTG